MRAAKYRRISDDSEGLELGVGRQDEDLDSFAAARGYEVVGDYVDNDTGASTASRKARPGFDKLLADARSGKFDIVIAYSASRLTRRPRENEDLIDLAQNHGIRFEYIRSPSFDLNTADGRMVARIVGSNDAAEAERTAERVTRALRQRAEKGQPLGGHRPFGFKTPAGPLEPAEAKLIRGTADRLLAGAVIIHLVREWNESGLLSPRGSKWARPSMLSVLTSPRVAGLSVYHKAPLRDADGNYVKAQWPAILDVDTWEAVCAKLEGNKIGRQGWQTYLLSGTVRCSCGALMYGGAIKGKPHIYRCMVDKGGCGKRSVAGGSLDRLVEKWVDQKLEDLVGALPAGPDWDGDDELREAEEQKAELLAAYKAKVLPGSIAFPQIAEREEQIARLTRERAAARRSQLPPSDARTEWRTGDFALRREIVKRLLAAVVVRPAELGSRSGRKFDHARIDPIER